MGTRNFSLGRLLPLFGAAVLLVGVLTLTGVRQAASAQSASNAAIVDYFLKIDGIEGDSTDARHKGEIELMSYGWGNNQPGLEQLLNSSTGGGGGAGKVKLHDIHFTTQTSKASPQLMLATAQGKHIPEATLTARKADKDQQEFLKIKLSDVMVSSYQTGAQNGESPSDQFSLNFGQIQFEYSSQKPDGSLDGPVVTGWDFKANERL